MVNEVMFKRIISNLVKNSIEAIGNNGRIEITARFDADKMIVKITDSGPGIAEDQVANLFKPFYTTKPGGTGLGLATAYKAAIDHGGDLRVESKIGGPTTFILTIPLKR
jgi:signal transduction histidine kinase